MTPIDRPGAAGAFLRARRRIADLLAPAVLVGALGIALALPAQAQENGGPTDPTDPDYGFVPDGREARPLSTVRFSEDGRYEHVIVGPAGEAGAAEALIAQLGARISRRHSLEGLGQYGYVVVFPSFDARARLLAALPQRAPGSGLSQNWTYRMAQSAPRLYAASMVGDTAPGACRLARPVRIGMLDGPVNTAHPALRGASVRHESLATTHRLPSADHGTGVAALIVGEDPASGITGFARGAQLHAVSVFERVDQVEETTVELLVLGLDRLVVAGVEIINLSLAGPESAALGRAVQETARRGIVMVGAAGNERARRVAYPAAFPEVIAITAIDAGRRRFALANTGPEIEFSAPGVDVFTARAGGGGYVSGTSFAAPIVAALAARMVADGIRDPGAIRSGLRAGAEAIGGGRNAEYGYGLVRRAC